MNPGAFLCFGGIEYTSKPCIVCPGAIASKPAPTLGFGQAQQLDSTPIL
ncbi:hypothetical protein [Pseudomonas sp. FEN]|nr:hypothetical protein [Pseudomonas sp. FEN]